jgi:proteic killer suppression protein
VITSFADKETAKVFAGEFSKKLPRDIQFGALQKLTVLDRCEDIALLWSLPGLKAEKLTVKGFDDVWSIRINRQWRIVFHWNETPPEASSVEICDYH